jgi:Fe-S cluster assembly ATP-binding protein
LDGRTSANILDYYNITTGIPDFARYFAAIQPDFVHVVMDGKIVQTGSAQLAMELEKQGYNVYN